MRVLRSLSLLAGIGLISLISAPLASGDQAWRTTLRLSEPTEIPGKILPAGDYVIKVVNTKETRSIVQFLDTKEAEVMATVLAVPNYRVPVPESTEFVYFRRAEGMPPALKSWVYPGNNYGVEFVYPKPEALTLAEKTMEPVMATPAETEPTLKSEVLVVSPENKETPLVEKQARLPKTGSFHPLVELIGLASLAGAAGLRGLVRRSS